MARWLQHHSCPRCPHTGTRLCDYTCHGGRPCVETS